MELHEKIRFMRMFKGWSQEEMSEKLGMTLSGYSKVERGEVDIYFSKIKQIAKTFGVDVSQLIGLDEKSVFNVIGNCENHNNLSSFNVYACEASKLQHELEKTNLINQQHLMTIESLKQEVAYLKEIINLMKNS
jgi:transcriptional regulator with XRE-family HTH domain